MQYNGGSGGRRDDGTRQYARLPREQQPAPVRPPQDRPPR